MDSLERTASIPSHHAVFLRTAHCGSVVDCLRLGRQPGEVSERAQIRMICMLQLQNTYLTGRQSYSTIWQARPAAQALRRVRSN